MVRKEVIDQWVEQIFKRLVEMKGVEIDRVLEIIKPLVTEEEWNNIRLSLEECIVLRRIGGC